MIKKVSKKKYKYKNTINKTTLTTVGLFLFLFYTIINNPNHPEIVGKPLSKDINDKIQGFINKQNELHHLKEGTNHQVALSEIQQGHKKSCWSWWEWPALRPVRYTRKKDFDLLSYSEAKMWTENITLRKRWYEITSDAVTKLKKGIKPVELFGSQVDADKFYENCSLVSLISRSDLHKKLAESALNVLNKGVNQQIRDEVMKHIL